MRFFPRFLIPAAVLAVLVSAGAAEAQNLQVITDLPGCDFQTGYMQARCIPIFIGHLIQLLFSVISVFFLLNVMFAGYQIAIGYVNGEKSQGIERLRWSIIGLIISVCAYLILNLGVSIITP